MKNETVELVVSKQALPIETKLSRSEIIELLIENMERDLKAQIEQLEVKEKLLQRVRFDEVADLVREGQFELSVNTYGQDRVELRIERVTLDNRFKKRVAEIKAVREEKNKLQNLVYELGNKKAKNVILRRFLESSDEGKAILKQLDQFKVGLQTKLLSAIGK